jgi:hypothetical protein
MKPTLKKGSYGTVWRNAESRSSFPDAEIRSTKTASASLIRSSLREINVLASVNPRFAPRLFDIFSPATSIYDYY